MDGGQKGTPKRRGIRASYSNDGGWSWSTVQADKKRTNDEQAIGSDPNAIATRRVVNFYEKLPRGPAPEVKATGILGRYQAKHFGKNPTAKRTYQPSYPTEQPEAGLFLGWTRAEYLGLDAVGSCILIVCDAAAIVHAIVFLLVLGYSQAYYFHLRTFCFRGTPPPPFPSRLLKKV